MGGTRRRGVGPRAAWIGVAALLGGALVLVVAVPWHGPIVLSLSAAHGVDAGDLPALALIVLAVAIAAGQWGGRARLPRLAAPLSAVVLGALLMAAALVGKAGGGPLAPSGGGTLAGTTEHVSAAAPRPVHEWSHVAVTYDSRRLRLYVDDEEVANRSATGELARTGDPLWIGGNRPYGEYFGGRIDEVRVYDRALDRAALRSEMATPIAVEPDAGTDGLVGAYAFDTRSRSAARDSSSFHNTGTVLGAGWTPRGRFGGSLRVDGVRQVVRIPASRSLDLTSGMTLAAWVWPAEEQAGWRTVLHRQTDVYFLTAGSDRDERVGVIDDLRVLLIVAAAIGLGVGLAGDRGRGLTSGRRRWWLAAALLLAGSAIDAALSPAPTLFGPLFVAAWLALCGAARRDAPVLGAVAALLAVVTVGALAGAGGAELARDDGSVARSAALGLVLLSAGVLGLRAAADEPIPPL